MGKTTIETTIHFGTGVGQVPGQRFFLFTGPLAGEGVFSVSGGLPCAWTTGAAPELRAGALLRAEREEHRVLGRAWVPGLVDGGENRPDALCWLVETLVPAPAAMPQARALELSRSGFALAWITLSDKGSRGERADASGPLVEELVRAAMPVSLARGFLMPDDERGIRALLTHLALEAGFDLIATTGGTGVAPRDVTPEATLGVIEKRLPGFERAMTITSLAKTPTGAVSRAVCGTLGGALILNLPGSPKAVRECLGAVLPAVAHTIEKLQGDPADCAQLAAGPGK